MILKERDSRERDIIELKRLLAYDLTPKQRFLIEREIASIKKGESGEDDSAYYINFYYGDSKRWVVIHDLRIELNGKVAQIDHILINRLFDIYVLESKNYRYGIRITGTGEFEVYYRGHYIGIPSPLEQNKRHIVLLAELIKRHRLMPTRLSIPISPNFLNYVLMSPSSVIKRPPKRQFDSSNVIKADTLNTVIEQRVDGIGVLDAVSSLAKMVPFSDIKEFGRRLVRFHRPSSIDWKKKFGIVDQRGQKQKKASRYFCARCKASISEKEAQFCWNNRQRFKGRAFCYNCQKKVRP